ncbi:MAG: hypothetical protein HZA50_16480 [Planctomycetes bacterium]|nr:hypothetical protein [Planctomycetota bacterium]
MLAKNRASFVPYLIAAVLSTGQIAFGQAASAPAAAPAAAPATAPAAGGTGQPAEGPGGEAAKPAQGFDAPDAKVDTMWRNFLHYVTIAQVELATSTANALVASDVQPKDVYLASIQPDNPKPEAILARAAKLQGMKELCDKIAKIILDGYQTYRSDPKYIDKSIRDMGTTLQAYYRAKEQIKISGEYALPQLIYMFGNANTSDTLRERIVTVLPEMGREAVRGLSCALEARDLKVVKVVANALGRIGYYHAAPSLRTALDRQDVSKDPDLVNVITAALQSCLQNGNNPAAINKPPAELYYDVALKYYYQHESLKPDERFDTAVLWHWQGEKLVPNVKIPREVFCDLYAMRMSRVALVNDPRFYPAVPLWLCAGFKRELDLAGAKIKADPTHPDGTQPHKVYALASSPRYLHEALARALNDQRLGGTYAAPLAIKVIEVLGMNVGARSLVEPLNDGAQPLVQALGYPDRHVRYPAAEALVLALPQERYNGSQLVMFVINEAVKQRNALLAVKDNDKKNSLKDLLRKANYEVIEEIEPDRIVQSMMNTGGIDVIIMAGDINPVQVLPRLRSELILQNTPLVIFDEGEKLSEMARKDGKTVVAGFAVGEPEFNKAVGDALKLTAGEPLTPEEVSSWSIRASKAIRLLGLTANKIYDINSSRMGLIGTLKSDNKDVRVAAGEALAVINMPECQQALGAMAILADTPEEVRIAFCNSATEHTRRFGPMLAEDQIKTLVTLVSDEKNRPSDALLVALSTLLGSQNVTSDKIQGLITSTVDHD